MRTRALLGFLLAATAMAQAAPPAAGRAHDILQSAFDSKNPDTRKQAAIALSLGGPREPFLQDLEAMLADKDVEVRLTAVSSLADLKTRQTVPALRKTLNDDVPEVSFAAAKALWAVNDRAGKEALLAVLMRESKSSSGFLTQQKRDALRMMHTPKSMFLFALKQGVGFAPVPGLGEGISSMQGILSDSGVSGRATAALLLGKEKDAETLSALREALADKEWSVRAAAVHSLALRNDPALQADLEPLLDDSKEGVRLRAAAGYLRLDDIRKSRAARRHAGASLEKVENTPGGK